jgi:hypothetical protein
MCHHWNRRDNTAMLETNIMKINHKITIELYTLSNILGRMYYIYGYMYPFVCCRDNNVWWVPIVTHHALNSIRVFNRSAVREPMERYLSLFVSQLYETHGMDLALLKGSIGFVPLRNDFCCREVLLESYLCVTRVNTTRRTVLELWLGAMFLDIISTAKLAYTIWRT